MSTIEKALAKFAASSFTARLPGADNDPFQSRGAGAPGGPALAAGLGPLGDGAPARRDAAPSRIHPLNLERLRRMGILTPDVKRSQLAEEYRLIKRPLLGTIDGKGAEVVANANLIMVTSALPGEGKTFSALNLAMSLAMERDRTVLLVDGDVAKPTAATRMGIEAKAGLIDLLAGSRQSLGEVMVQTDVPNLRVLPAGARHERATELLASERMARVMDELSTRYRDRVVIFDSPPLLLSSESAVLADRMGQIILVVAAEQTLQHLVSEALGRLAEEKIVGLLLNKYRPGLGNEYGYGSAYGYRYGYGYGYGYGYADAGRDGKAPGGARERAPEDLVQG